MRIKPAVAELEEALAAAQGGIALYRRGVDEAFMSHGFPRFYEKLAAARRDLEELGMYERCRDALVRAEALYREGPDHDEEGQDLILEANRALMKASGSYEAMSRRYRAANDDQQS